MKTGEVLRNPEAYVELWAAERKNATADDLDTLLLAYDRDVDTYNYNQVIESAGTQSRPKFLKPKSNQLLTCAFQNYLRTLPKKQRKELCKIINGHREDLSRLRQWVKAVTGDVKDNDVYIMAHWLWLVKRNSLELPVVHHIMPIITHQKQGGGKTTAIKKLIEVVNDLTLDLKIQQVVDERSFTMFSNYLVCFFDEMAGADKIDISDFKRNVTSSSLTYRPMRTNHQVRVPNLCTFIGATNNEIYDVIKDTTGIRRFFPIKALPLLDHESINAIDYLKLWQGINELLPRGYYELVQAEVMQEQEDLALKDGISLFLEERSLIPEAGIDETKLVPGKEIFQEYLLDAANSGVKFTVQRQVFYKRLKSAGLKGIQKRDSNKTLCWYFLIRKESQETIGMHYDS